MENQPQWSEVIRIMVTGFGAVFVIMVMLAVVTTLVGKLMQKFEKPKEEETKAT
ncbi:MAG: OadG family protein [Deltaproteobacteria bacterium]